MKIKKRTLTKEKLVKVDFMLKKSYEGNRFIAYRQYGLAIQAFEIALEIAYSKVQQESLHRKILHCRMAEQGIVYFENSYYHGGVKIPKEDAISIAKMGSVRVGRPEFTEKTKKRRKGISIRMAILDAIKKNSNLTLKEATEIAQSVKPNTKFNESHLAYYKSMAKKGA